jgi:hypothetical protein
VDWCAWIKEATQWDIEVGEEEVDGWESQSGMLNAGIPLPLQMRSDYDYAQREIFGGFEPPAAA